MRQTAVLGADERLAVRPFTDPERSGEDAAVMARMLRRLRADVASWPPSRGGLRLERRQDDGNGHRHWVVVPRPDAMSRARDLTAVGFFGDLRAGVDHAAIYLVEEMVVARLDLYATRGLLCYFDAELSPGVHGNLVLFSTSGIPDEWHVDAVHTRAVALAPRHYLCVRLHRACLHGPFLGDDDLEVTQTRYFDFTEEPTWTALRRFALHQAHREASLPR